MSEEKIRGQETKPEPTVVVISAPAGGEADNKPMESK